MLENDEFFIQLLRYGAKDLSMGGKGLTYNDLKAEIQDYGYKVETFDEHQKIWQIIRKAFVYPEGIGGNRKYYLSIDSFFSLLDYVELNELGSKQNIHLNN